MNDTPHTAQRDVVVTLRDATGRECCRWLLTIDASLTPDEALPGCADFLLPQAIADGEIDPARSDTARFSLREVDPALDADLLLQQAASLGAIH